MKPETSISLVFTTILSALAILAFTGCGTLDKLYDQQVVTESGQIIKTNVVYQTNVVMVAPAGTNAATGEVIPPRFAQVITPEISYDYSPPMTRTNLVPKPGTDALLGVGGSLPIPWAGPVGILIGAAYGIYANVRNKKTARALITGIDAGRKILNETPEGKALDKKVRDALIQHQAAAGVLGEVTKLVQAYTGPTTR